MNIINAAFVRNGVTVRTLPVYQYDSGMILHISGLNDLPSTFRADFSNTETGQSKSVIGTDGEVHIPYEYFVPGATIHCWLVWSGEDTVTRKHIMIPIARRATPTDEEPSPDEQGVIDQAIAALNDAVAQTGQDVETAAGYAGQAEQSAQAATDAKDNAMAAQNAARAYRDQAVQYTSDAAESAQSAFQSKTDAQAAAARVAGAMDTLEATIQADLQAAKESGMFDGPQGPQGVPGERGEPGEPGADGVTFTPAVSSEGVISWTNNGGKTNPQPVNIKGPTGQTGPQGERGLTGETGPAGPAGPAGATGPAGADGISPTIAVTDITGGHRVTITDATGPHSFDVLDGDAADAPVQDVQVHGVSVLTDGVANVPIGSLNNFGVFKRGSGLYDANGVLTVNSSTDANVKNGTAGTYTSVTRQHLATFYGLAKAAGSDEKNSTLPVGQYTDEAKIAIQKMLGIYEAPWELIREDTFTNETEADHIITTDANGEAFELTDVILMFETPQQETYASKGAYGQVSFYFANAPAGYAPYNVIESGNWTQEANTKAKGAFYIIEKKEGLLFFERGNPVGSTSSSNLGIRWTTGFDTLSTSQGILPDASTPLTFNKINIRSVTGTGHYKLYGKRKWN